MGVHKSQRSFPGFPAIRVIPASPTLREKCAVRALHFYAWRVVRATLRPPLRLTPAIDLPAGAHLLFPSVGILSERPGRRSPSEIYGQCSESKVRGINIFEIDIWWKQLKQQIPPLRFAPVGMTHLVGRSSTSLCSGRDNTSCEAILHSASLRSG